LSDYSKGCDISRWQDDPTTPEHVDFERMKRAGIDFVYLKASQSTWTDSTFERHWSAAKAAGLLRGAFHFMTWKGVVHQADHFTGLLTDDPGELPPMVDYEWWGRIPSNVSSLLSIFVSRFKANTGQFPGIYTAPGFWQPYGAIAQHFADCPLWIAHWLADKPTVPKPWKTWTFWQITNKGHGPTYGVESQQVDLNYYNGTTEELIKTFGPDSVGANGGSPVSLSDSEKLSILWNAYKERKSK
jgi:lysozyme